MTEAEMGELYDFIRRQRHGVVSTVREDGHAQSALVGIAVTPALEICFDTTAMTRKTQALRRDPRVAFVIGWDDQMSVQYEGLADEPKGAELAALKAVYYAAFADGPGRESWPGITWVRVRPRWIRFSDFKRSSDIVREWRF